MSSINGVNKSLFPNNLTTDKKEGQDRKGAQASESDKTADNKLIDTNKLIIEMHLKIQIESKTNFGTQVAIEQLLADAGVDLSQFMYNGKPITDLTQDEATELVSDDGYFGITQTAQRIFEFASSMAGDDPERLQTARDAVLKGFKEAEELFGGSLPDISHDTISAALELIDGKISELGGSVVNIQA